MLLDNSLVEWTYLPSSWREKLPLPLNQPEVEEKEISLHILTQDLTPIVPVDKFFSFDHLKRITAWIIRFIQNSQTKNTAEQVKAPLTTIELQAVENQWIKVIQVTHFERELVSIQRKIPSPNPALSYRYNHFLIPLTFSL